MLIHLKQQQACLAVKHGITLKPNHSFFEGKSCGCGGDDYLTATAPNALRGLA
jgi:hypothetical protein